MRRLDNFSLGSGSLRGKRGQKFLHEMLIVLDKMPEKRLISIVNLVGEVRGIDISEIDDYWVLAEAFGIPTSMLVKVIYENDKIENETLEARWLRMRQWVVSQIIEKDEMIGAARRFRGFKDQFGTYE